MKDFLHQLIANGADNTAQVKKLLDAMAASMEKGDSHLLTQSAIELLEIRSQDAVSVNSASE